MITNFDIFINDWLKKQKVLFNDKESEIEFIDNEEILAKK